MTSRPPLGVQQRQPQRKLSAPILSQRPAVHQRNLSQQQYLPPSPIRKETTFHDFVPSDGAGADSSTTQGQGGRYAAAQRRGGSRLKLELSHDAPDSITQQGISESPNAIDSSKPFTPSRMMPPTDLSELGDLSPHLSAHAHTNDTDNDAPLPMPRRRQRFVSEVPRHKTPPAPVRKDSRPKPYTVEIPAAAPRFHSPPKDIYQGKTALAVSTTSTGASPSGAPPFKYADFSPWSGNHLEDRFSESAVRQGYYDKPTMPQTETSSAKTSLFTSLKQRGVISALSTVFTSVLGQRRYNGRITAPSTFKPPPRVTLTDTKKEIWLKDLANPAISLRRLSRTIPHGIRGKALLDQCLNKNVPTDRAVWLARCVGANEIRAYKRKAVPTTIVMGGELKWYRDWTVSVEQFVENIVFGFAEDDWKTKVNYAIRLATHFYDEYLLDREHYMEWLVSSLENTQQNKLPMWMLITQIYWNDLLKLRKYGRRLVTALISHHHVIHNHPDKDIFLPLISKLAFFLNTLIIKCPDNFVSPGVWSKHRDILKTCLPPGDEARQKLFQAIGHRNDQLVASANRSQPAARHILVRMLDGTLQTPMPDELPTQCWSISKDKAALVKALLEWCTSLYRPGMAKIYVTSRILWQWSALGADVTTTILELLDVDTFDEQGRRDALYHLVCELVRSGIFSVPQYGQWLMARGGLTNTRDIEPDGPGSTRLLAELPPHALNESQRSLPLDPANPISHRKPLSMGRLSQRISTGCRALKAEIGCWLRASLAPDAGLMGKGKNKDVRGGPEISPSMFNAVRSVLEAAEDFSMLADILNSLTRYSNVEILAAIADTVNRHLFIMAALGASRNLFSNLHKQLQITVREQGIGARPLLASLVGLAPRIPGLEELATQLKRDLDLADRHNPVDACSPVSDNMVARLQDDDGDLHEEIEKLLTGGTSLDRNTMDRLFQTVSQRLQMYWAKSNDKQRVYSVLLGRLRMFDMQHFDMLLKKWLFYLRTLNNRPSILRIFPLLVCVGCLSMSTILGTTLETSGARGAAVSRPPAPGSVHPQVVQLTYRTRYMQEVLQLFMAPIPQDGLVAPEERYRFCILQDQAHRENPKELLGLIRLALAEYSFARTQNDSEGLPLDDSAAQSRLLELVRLLVLKDALGVARALAVKSPDAHVGSWIDYMTTKLLIPSADNQTHVTFDQVLELTNEFTLPFCQVKLSLGLASNDQTSQESADRQQSHVEMFANAMEKAIDAKNISWTGMLSCLSPEITHHLKSRAQSRFLDLLPSIRNPSPADRTLDQSLQMAENLLSVMDAIIRGGSMGRQPQLVPAMVEKFSELWEILASPDHADAKPPVLNHWLPLLLNFITLHAQTFDTSKPSNEVRAKALIVCAGLMQELEALHGSEADTGPLGGRIFDLACLFVDNLADDLRAMCVRAVKDSTSDARLRYLFSFQAAALSDKLMHCTRDKVPPGRAMGLPIGQLLGTPAAMWGLDRLGPERLTVFNFRRWEMLSEPTPNVGENDTALSLGLFQARRIQ
ncbi:hypothetical protein B0T17DRAFT_588631 [Bombardia bombarda]|uniref:Mediator of RNA polymerase II transcription subunit 12 n=1 Tax=Bombardia bombarda TaxID=252184 RepID=A0AA39X7D6_9PEZI|nr:hypothetical protein B0T17DRAFT_588631 [Bombardia bombarda]